MRISDWSSDVCSSDLETRADRECLTVGDEAVVAAVRIHDRQPLDAVPLGAALGDIGDAAVEEGRFARQARIDGIGAFMRRAAPVGGLDFEPLANQLAAERGIIQIAADRQSVVSGKSVSVRVDLGGRRIIKKKKK